MICTSAISLILQNQRQYSYIFYQKLSRHNQVNEGFFVHRNLQSDNFVLCYILHIFYCVVPKELNTLTPTYFDQICQTQLSDGFFFSTTHASPNSLQLLHYIFTLQ